MGDRTEVSEIAGAVVTVQAEPEERELLHPASQRRGHEPERVRGRGCQVLPLGGTSIARASGRALGIAAPAITAVESETLDPGHRDMTGGDKQIQRHEVSQLSRCDASFAGAHVCTNDESSAAKLMRFMRIRRDCRTRSAFKASVHARCRHSECSPA